MMTIILHKNPKPQEKCMVEMARGIPISNLGFLSLIEVFIPPTNRIRMYKRNSKINNIQNGVK